MLAGASSAGGRNAHIVRFVEYQAVKKIDPRGVEIRKSLILRQTNNVCVAPPARLFLSSRKSASCIPTTHHTLSQFFSCQPQPQIRCCRHPITFSATASPIPTPDAVIPAPAAATLAPYACATFVGCGPATRQGLSHLQWAPPRCF